MNKNKKQDVISEVKEILENSNAVYLTDYSGIAVEEINSLRNDFRNKGVKYKVIKNTLFNRALSEVGKFEKLSEHLEGMTGYAFTTEDPVAPAKIIKKFFDDKKKMSLKACYIEDKYYNGDQLATLASLPTKSEVIASILSSINAPISGIVGALNAVTRDLVNVVDQISKRST
ncbi:MAG: 50S ribosomal protein L10 [Ignavibacteriales bacterium CG12_big_fil_rev_8_21_14_0_65_30_8]|nr:MAG: 50S ribosomal protein L10 [Ignavibacteriales bacterium CG12_big_fil_rev_8_21_14_0_65_30_8]